MALKLIKNVHEMYIDAAKRSECVLSLRDYLRQLSPKDVVSLGEVYLSRKCGYFSGICQDEKHLFLDILIEFDTPEVQHLIVKWILNNSDSSEEEIRRTLFHLHALKVPTQVCYQSHIHEDKSFEFFFAY